VGLCGWSGKGLGKNSRIPGSSDVPRGPWPQSWSGVLEGFRPKRLPTGFSPRFIRCFAWPFPNMALSSMQPGTIPRPLLPPVPARGGSPRFLSTVRRPFQHGSAVFAAISSGKGAPGDMLRPNPVPWVPAEQIPHTPPGTPDQSFPEPGPCPHCLPRPPITPLPQHRAALPRGQRRLASPLGWDRPAVAWMASGDRSVKEHRTHGSTWRPVSQYFSSRKLSR